MKAERVNPRASAASSIACSNPESSERFALAGLPLSTYWATLSYSLARGYPLGSLLPWGVGRALVGQDLLWLFQPYLAFMAAMLALSR